MNKLLMTLLSGMLITFIVDFFLFLGMKINYLEKNGIDIFYNVFFADNQNFILFFIFSFIFGSIVIYVANKTLTTIMVVLLSLFAASALVPDIGNSYAKMIFMKQNQSFNSKRHHFYGDVYYEGRGVIYFYDNELKRIIKLKEEELVRWKYQVW